MGYACPVCEDPQADGEHLANHLAFTAMLGDDAHEAWLDDHAPDWAGLGPAELAERVTARAEETDYPQVFEDTTGGADDRGEREHAHGHGRGHGNGRAEGDDGTGDALEGAPGGVADVEETLATDDLDRDPDDVLAEARELTRRRRANTEAASDEERTDEGGDSGAGADAADGTASDE